MLARHPQWRRLLVRCSIKTAERIELVLGTGPTLSLSHTWLEGDSDIFKTKVLSSGIRTSSQTLDT